MDTKKRLRIGEAAKILGVSTDTLRYYEKAGLLSPAQKGENGYRYYESEDLYLMEDALFYRSIDLPIEDVKGILHDSDFHHIDRVIERKRGELVEQIRQQRKLLEKIDSLQRLYRKVEKNLYRLGEGTMAPVSVLASVQVEDPQEAALMMFQTTEWKELIFYLKSLVHLPGDPALLRDPLRVERSLDGCRLSVVVDEADVEAAGIGPSQIVDRMEYPRCVASVFHTEERSMGENISQLYLEMEGRGYELDGEVVCEWLMATYHEDRVAEYYAVYFPIKE